MIVCIYTHIYIWLIYILAIKNNEILLLVTIWMDLEGIVLSEIEKDKYYMISLICIIWERKNIACSWIVHIGSCQRWGLGDGRNG